jgi:plasmid stabilization system protein ParE
VPGVDIVWEPEAEADLDSILEYISQDNLEAAINVVPHTNLCKVVGMGKSPMQ